MTPGQAQSFLSRVSYKPGTKMYFGWLDSRGIFTRDELHFIDPTAHTFAIRISLMKRNVKKVKPTEEPLAEQFNPVWWNDLEIIPVASQFEIRIEDLKDMQHEEFAQFIKACIEKMERHEIDEWLKVDGRWVTDPHPELRV